MKLKLPERRRFVRIETPLRVVFSCGDRTEEVITRNISPVGMMFETGARLDDDKDLEMDLFLPSREDPVKLKGRIVWQSRTSLEDNSPFQVGVEILDIGDEGKNDFLKFLCDLLYDSVFKARA
jgi:hypothetical protein